MFLTLRAPIETIVSLQDKPAAPPLSLPEHPISTRDHSTHWVSRIYPRHKLSKSLSVATIAIKMIIVTTGMLFWYKTYLATRQLLAQIDVCFFLHSSLYCNFCATMYMTSKLNLMISEIIHEVISNWDSEHSRITVESFQCKKDCLVIIKIRNWSEKHHFLKSAISIKPSNFCHLDKLRTLFSHFETSSQK